MPYKDKEKQKEIQRQWFQNNKEKQRQKTANQRHKRAKWFFELKKNYSCECGENHPACIDFHHTDPATKVKGVSDMVVWGFSEETILLEIAKCKAICANCHRKCHWNEMVSSGIARCMKQ